MGRRGWAVAVAVVLASLVLVQVRRATRYAVETLWRAPWGGGGVATAVGADGQTYGPLAFDVGGGRIVLADSYGRRLLLIPAAGGPATAVDLGPSGPLVADLAVGRGGTLYLGDREGTLWRWSPQAGRAEVVQRFGARGDHLAVIEGLAVLPGGDPVVDLLTVSRRQVVRSVFALPPGESARLIVRLSLQETSSAGQVEAPYAAVPAGSHALAVGAGGTIYLLGLASGGRRAVYSFRADGERLRSTPLPERLGRLSLLGVDGGGRIYLGVDLGRPGGQVLKLSPRGRELLARSVPMDGRTQLGFYSRVDGKGDIYLLEPTGAGVSLRRWRPLDRLSLAWRWERPAVGRG